MFVIAIETIENCNNPIAIRSILESLMANIVKCAKIDRYQVNKLIRLLKRESLLDRSTAQLLITQFPFLEKDIPVYLGAQINDTSSFLKIIEKAKVVNMGLL